MIRRLSAGHRYHLGYLCHFWHVPTQEPDSLSISTPASRNQRSKIAASLSTARRRRGAPDLLRLRFAITSLFNLWLLSVSTRHPNSITVLPYAAAHPANTYHISRRLKGAKRLFNLAFSGTLKHKLPFTPSDGIGLVLHKTKTPKSYTSIRTRHNFV